jgi:DNA processing protein
MLNLNSNEQKIVKILQEKGQAGIDEISLLSNVQQSKLAITILGLEMQGIVLSLPGKIYKLI